MKFNVALKELVSLLLWCTGIPFFIRNIYARNKATILIYHNPRTEILERHLAYLSHHHNFTTLDILVKAIRTGDWSVIPQKAIVITVDDGYKENFALMKVFKEYRVVPTIYVCTRIIDTNRHFWFKIHGIRVQPLKRLFNSDRLKYLAQKVGYTPTKQYPEQERQALNLQEIICMKDFVDFQSHSCFHPILTACHDEECKEEIIESRRELEALLGKKCKHFAFPNGDYTERELGFLRKAGYLSARTIDLGWNDLNTDPYKLKAMGITDNALTSRLAIQVCGIPAYFRFVLEGSIKGKWRTIRPRKTPGRRLD